LSAQKLINFLDKTALGHPELIAALIDEGVQILPDQIIGLIKGVSISPESFIGHINEAFEQNILVHSLGNEDINIAQLVFNVGEQFLNPEQMSLLSRTLCGHSRTKRICGQILNIFAANMTPDEAALFVYGIVSHDFFYDLRGKLESFLAEMPEVNLLLFHSSLELRTSLHHHHHYLHFFFFSSSSLFLLLFLLVLFIFVIFIFL
jgi:hypothetical protein